MDFSSLLESILLAHKERIASLDSISIIVRIDIAQRNCDTVGENIEKQLNIPVDPVTMGNKAMENSRQVRYFQLKIKFKVKILQSTEVEQILVKGNKQGTS